MRRVAAAVLALVLLVGCTDDGDDGEAAADRQTTSAPRTSSTTTSASTTTTAVPGDAGAPGLGDPYFPKLGNGGYDVDHYRLRLDYEPATNVLEGTATIEATASEDLSAFNLDLSGMEVEAIEVDGRPADHERRGGELTITPERGLAGGEGFEVLVTYGGEPEPIAASDAAPFSLGWTGTGDGAYVASEPDGASTFFPVNDHPSDKATYTFVVTVPDGVEVVTNGLLQGIVDAPGPSSTWSYEATDPMASYLVQVAIGDFALIRDKGPGGLELRHAVPLDLAEEASEELSVTAEMVEVLADSFGPYPLEAYGVLVVDEDLPFALETQTLSLFGRGVLEGPGANQAFLVHELAHQWFGDSLTPATWREVWLNEGFATYAEWLWEAHLAGDPAVADEIARVEAANGEGLAPPGDPGVAELFGPGVYLRGGLTLHALRLAVGDDAFFETLRTYAAGFADGNVETADFVAVAERVSGQRLDDLFDAWLTEEALPELPPVSGG